MNTWKAWATLALTLAFAVSPLVSDPFTGFTADQFPIPQVDPPAQPAGWAFSIWGVIYAWLVVSAAFGALRRPDATDWDAARAPLMISLAAGVPWLAIATRSSEAASALIWVMLGGAVFALVRAPQRDRWLLAAPVGLYAGWLTAASFVSLASIGAGYGILTDQVGWAYIAVIGALAIALPVQLRRPGVPTYAIAIGWALIGIIAANGYANVGISLAAAAAILVLAALPLRQRVTA
ncbi:hypothetical protein AADZ90_007750 [Aestuariibius sp. 2305UL40-4]|uniref:hypothetical protein n=1 Tax=Aestuariibius violaceus TaxID=3234132 RepID=UPI00345E289F